MSEIDPVIFEFRAKVDGYLSQLRSTTTKVDTLLGTQEKKVRQLEAQFRRSSGQISGSLKGLAGSLATYFSGRELVGLIDNFTRLQNSLRVAGLEGQGLASVQKSLIDISTQYGVSINSLADLYGKNALTAKDLGASQADLLTITKETAQALLITGTSTEQAQGAILGLSQALASGTVRAEEFNQINEGGLRPLLQAAAASDRWGGSIAKLRADIIAGKVSSLELFKAFLEGTKIIEKQAAPATLTLAGAFQSLNTKLIEYVGSAATSSGVTGNLAAAIQSLANNLDTIIPALAVIGAALGVRFVANAVAGSFALRALSAYAVTATASLGGAALAARAFGTALLGALGGPVGLALTALTVGLYAVINYTADAAAASGEYAAQQKTLTAIQERTKNATDALASATGRARAEALANARALREETLQYLANAKAALIAARAKAVDARAKAQYDLSTLPTNSGAGGGPDRLVTVVNKNQPGLVQANANFKAADQNVRAAEKLITDQDAIIKANTPAKVANVGTAKTKGGPSGSKGSGPSGPSAAETASRHADEIARLEQEELRARIDLTDDAKARADLQKDLLLAERDDRVRQVENNKDFNRAQKDAQIAAINRIYGRPAKTDNDGNIVAEGRPGLLAQRLNADFDRQQAELALAMIDAEQSTLQSQSDIETSTAKRYDIERRMLALQQTSEAMGLELAIANGRVLDAVKARALLEEKQVAEKEKLRVSQLSPGAKYAYDLRASAANINDAVQSIQVQGLQSLNDGLAEAILGTKSLGDVFKNVANQIIGDLLRIAIQQAIIKPLADALFGGGSKSSGGGLGSILSTITSVAGMLGSKGGSVHGGSNNNVFGRASGGYVAPGQVVRVNEGASPGRVEGFMSRDGGQIIPLGRMKAQGGGGTTVVQTFHLDARGAVMTQDLVDQMNEIGREAAVAGAQGGHAMVWRDLASRQRPRM